MNSNIKVTGNLNVMNTRILIRKLTIVLKGRILGCDAM